MTKQQEKEFIKLIWKFLKETKKEEDLTIGGNLIPLRQFLTKENKEKFRVYRKKWWLKKNS